MSHALRYYKDLEQPDGTIIRLEIHRKTDGDTIMVSKEIGRVVQALHLDIQGGSDDIDAPIVKTSLTMTFVDAPDLDANKKCGNWEEFYTPDSTMWKVILKANGNTIWGGYITPDSYCEDLRYRGSVTIIARDNIGHMQDFPFDAEGDENGMISLRELVEGAWAKIESPMQLYWDAGLWMRTEDDVIAYNTRMNVSAFEDMNWYDAVEKALYSYGAVLRYIGGNEVQVCSLRYMPQQGRGDINKVPHISPIFVAHAQRELAPAARRIEESVKYELTDGQQMPLAKNVAFTGAESTCRFRSVNIFGETQWKTIPVHPISRTSGEGWNNTPSTTLLFNPKEYTIRENALKDDAERMLFLACNTDGANSVRFSKVVVCQPFNIGITFGRPIERDSFGGVAYCYGFSNSSDTTQNGIGSISAQTVDCYITCEQNGITQYFNGNKWQTESVKITLNVENRQCGIDLSFSDLVGVATLTLTVVNVELNGMRDYSDGYGLYIPISSMKFGVVNALTLCETNRVNTNYIDSNNVIVSRSPELAPALDEVPFPAVIKNGIFVKSGSAYLPANEWYWPNGTPQQMAVYNHLQLLCYHGKPNNVISGDITNVNFENIATIYEWNGAEHILVSGSYNFISGRLESAVLREFTRYEDMWGDVSGTEMPTTEQQRQTNAESGGSPKPSPTYTNETNVNFGGTITGSTTLAGLEDVQVSYPSDGDLLIYDAGLRKWVNRQPESADFKTINGESLQGEGDIQVNTHYAHLQPSASDTWVIEHNMNRYPSVTVVDSAGTEVIGEKIYNSENQVTLKFSSPFAGKAYLN